MTNFYIGQRVVCIKDAKPTQTWPGKHSAVKGCVYTVRDVGEWSHEGLGILLEEIINPIHPYYQVECAFRAARFRPVKDTNIDVFQKMLAPTPTRELETTS